MPEFILSDQHLFAFKGETVVPDLVFFYASGQQFSVVMFLIHLRQGSFQGIAQRSFPPGRRKRGPETLRRARRIQGFATQTF